LFFSPTFWIGVLHPRDILFADQSTPVFNPRGNNWVCSISSMQVALRKVFPPPGPGFIVRRDPFPVPSFASKTVPPSQASVFAVVLSLFGMSGLAPPTTLVEEAPCSPLLLVRNFSGVEQMDVLILHRDFDPLLGSPHANNHIPRTPVGPGCKFPLSSDNPSIPGLPFLRRIWKKWVCPIVRSLDVPFTRPLSLPSFVCQSLSPPKYFDFPRPVLFG